MRIVIEDNTAATISTASPSASVSQPQAENGGGGPEATGGSNAAAGDDAGGPPQWLLEAVGRAMADEGSTPGVTAPDATDGGAAPER